MRLFNLFRRAADRTPQPPVTRPRLTLENLEAREVPAALLGLDQINLTPPDGPGTVSYLTIKLAEVLVSNATPAPAPPAKSRPC